MKCFPEISSLYFQIIAENNSANNDYMSGRILIDNPLDSINRWSLLPGKRYAGFTGEVRLSHDAESVCDHGLVRLSHFEINGCSKGLKILLKFLACVLFQIVTFSNNYNVTYYPLQLLGSLRR